MPPSPAMRCSPGRELRLDNHKRGRSLEGGILVRERDDELALFNEVQNRERDNFLLQSTDDFEDTFSTKLRYFSDYKLGISIPVRGETSDLLNADGEKNDYDWLLTPPDTPLFTSLDDEAPPVNLAQRGRPRSKPISISRSSTMEKSYRSSRGSASPNRLSPSPRSGNSVFQSRGRPSSAPHSSPPHTLRNTPPPRISSSPPPSKPSTPAPRSSTPTPQRMSTGSSSHTVTSSRVCGTSPVKTSRGNSASPKVRAWQSNIPGFSSEAPPNLRTSLADRPASYVRGSSPASRNGRDSYSKSGRQSMSPTASRSVSSSHSHDRDRFSSHSKGSVASSGDDDVDSLQSIPVGCSDRSATRSAAALSNTRGRAFPKKSTRIASPNSAPKRSFDLALRQMDHRKGPQNMFRPLLSSVPSSTFYVGKASAAHRAMLSRNSSVTTSSNASSDQATSGALDTEGSEPNQDDITSKPPLKTPPHTDLPDEVFAFDHADDDALNEHNEVPAVIHIEEDAADDDDDGLKNTLFCSECGSKYDDASQSNECEVNLCPDCRSSHESLSITAPIYAEKDTPGVSEPEFPETAAMDVMKPDQTEAILKEEEEDHDACFEPNPIFSSENALSEPLVVEEVDHKISEEPETTGVPKLGLDVSLGTGISVLLGKSGSGKWPILRSRTFTATTIAYDDLSYVRDSINNARSSLCHGSASASSSSLDLGVHVPKNGKKPDLEKTQFTESSCSDNNNVGGAPPQEQWRSPDNTETDDKSNFRLMGSSNMENVNLGEDSIASISNFDETGSDENDDDLANNSMNIADMEGESVVILDSSKAREDGFDIVDVEEMQIQNGLNTISEIEIDNGGIGSPSSQSGVISHDSDRSSMDELHEPPVTPACDKDEVTLISEPETSNNLHGIHDEPTVIARGDGSAKARSLTLEEATDTILFCSSIIHNLAYDAATIAIEKEKEMEKENDKGKENLLFPFEPSRPTFSMVGKSNPDRHRTPAGKSPKTRRRRVEIDKNTPHTETESDVKKTDLSPMRMVGVSNKGDNPKPPKLESKCNCSIM